MSPVCPLSPFQPVSVSLPCCGLSYGSSEQVELLCMQNAGVNIKIRCRLATTRHSSATFVHHSTTLFHRSTTSVHRSTTCFDHSSYAHIYRCTATCWVGLVSRAMVGRPDISRSTVHLPGKLLGTRRECDWDMLLRSWLCRRHV